MKLTFLLLLVASTTFGQAPVVGQWKTVDDNSDEVKAIVELSESRGTINGKILSIFNKEQPDPVCDTCAEDDDALSCLGRRGQSDGQGILGSLLSNPDMEEVTVIYNGSIGQNGKLKAF